MMPRAFDLCRSWLFVPGGEEAPLVSAATCGADVLIQELEDFTPSALLPEGRRIAKNLYSHWRAAGAVAAVRINPLAGAGMDDLSAVMQGAPDIVALPKVSGPDDVRALDEAVTQFERDYSLEPGQTRLLPNIESARGLVRIGEVIGASERIMGCLIASEDLAADLGAERGRDGAELAYARQRFLFECVAAGTLAVDCPYTWADTPGLEHDTRWAKRLGYKAKSAVLGAHAGIINAVLTPSRDEIADAQRIVQAFETAREKHEARAEVDGSLVEMPTYANAKRLLERAQRFGQNARDID